MNTDADGDVLLVGLGPVGAALLRRALQMLEPAGLRARPMS
ncbi:hypothetical protein [Piscinibacter sp. XHJ-5]|nr:hypothetical protein [Piscinibacter sp. XHJ-5]